MLLVSTYELGHQPLHVASPAGALLRAGHEVRCTDLAVDPFDIDSLVVGRRGGVLGAHAHRHAPGPPGVPRDPGPAPDIALCLYGLYAGLDGGRGRPTPVADLAIAGEYEPALVAWVDALRRRRPSAGPGARRRGTVVELGRGRFGLPARHLLPGLDRYARLALGDERRLAGYVEASHGCAHRCRHCPVPVVYDGRTRLVGDDAVVADVAQLVAMGPATSPSATPTSSTALTTPRGSIDAVHGAFPDLTFDVTAKVEHILRHRDMWPRMGAAGCLFAVSAFESASDHILDQLDKGHTAAEEAEAVAVLRAAGIEPRPSLLPFTPWTTARGRVRPARPRGALRPRRQRGPGAVRHPAPRPPRLAARHLGRLDGRARPLRRRAPGMDVARARPPARRPPGAARRVAERAGAEEWSAAGVLRRGARRRRRGTRRATPRAPRGAPEADAATALADRRPTSGRG